MLTSLVGDSSARRWTQFTVAVLHRAGCLKNTKHTALGGLAPVCTSNNLTVQLLLLAGHSLPSLGPTASGACCTSAAYSALSILERHMSTAVFLRDSSGREHCRASRLSPSFVQQRSWASAAVPEMLPQSEPDDLIITDAAAEVGSLIAKSDRCVTLHNSAPRSFACYATDLYAYLVSAAAEIDAPLASCFYVLTGQSK